MRWTHTLYTLDNDAVEWKRKTFEFLEIQQERDESMREAKATNACMFCVHHEVEN